MDKIIASIITYNPEIDRLEKNIKSIVNQVDSIVIIDNKSSNLLELNALCNNISNEYKNCKFEIIKNEENVGIAKALNQALYYAKDKNFKWILTLDQDSICDSNMISKMKDVYELCNNNKIEIVAPNIIDENKMGEIEPMKNEIEYPTVVITSGALTNVDITITVGGFEEKLFIDYVDHEICLRLRKNGYDIVKYRQSKLYHQLGEIKTYKIFGRKATATNHSALRRYYYYRNGIYVKEKYEGIFDEWIKIDRKRRLRAVLAVILFEDNKCEKLLKSIEGVLDGKKAKYGKYNR